jgi:PAS domain S-box-containing protein
MTERLSVLLVEDSPAEVRLFREMLNEMPGASETIEVTSVGTLRSTREWLKDHTSDVIVLDLGLPDSAGLNTLSDVRKSAPETPVVVLTGLDDEATGLAAIRHGAYEYLIKGSADGRAVTRTLRYAVEQRRAIDALRASEARLRALIDNSFDIVALLDANVAIRFVSNAALTVFGRTPHSLTGSNPLALIHPEDVPDAQRALSCCLANPDRPVKLRGRILHANGDWRWVDIVGCNRFNDPAVGGVVVNLRDVTDRVELEREQIALHRASGELLDTLEVSALAVKVCRIAVEHLGLDVAWVGYAEADGSVTALAGWPEIPAHILSVPTRWDESPQGQGPTGRALRTLTPVVCQDVTTDERFAAWRAGALSSGIAASLALPLISRDRRFGVLNAYSKKAGSFMPSRIEMLAAYAHHAASSLENARLYETLARELAEREQIESQLRQAQKMEAVGRLAGGIAQDFNNVLAAIIGHAELARDDVKAGSQLAADLDEVLNAADRAASLTKQLLALGRTPVLDAQPLDLCEVVRGLERMLMPLIGDHIRFAVQTDEAVPRICADRGQIEQVILNLVVSARDAMEDGGDLRISVGVSEPPRLMAGAGPCVLLTVADTGRGMDPETASRVFEPFFTTKERGRGSGLGLSTVYSTVRQSGGHIEVESEPDKGTVFRIFLRRVPPDAVASAPVP